jgi:hypothetical protein
MEVEEAEGKVEGEEEEAESKVEGEEEEAEGKESVGVCALNLISFLILKQCMYELKQSNC